MICTECPEDYVLRKDVCVYDNISSTTTEPDIESGICHPGHYWSAVDEVLLSTALLPMCSQLVN